MMKTSVLILAAGKGVRMKSDRPKVLHSVGGTPMIDRVVRSALELKPQSLCIILGHGATQVQDHLKTTFPKIKFHFAIQKNLDGTGGAVRQALPWVKNQKGYLIVACGDAPLIQTATLKALLDTHHAGGHVATVLSAHVPNPTGYGRILRGRSGEVQSIVEQLDATEETKNINEINTGTYCFDALSLAVVVPRLKNNNAKKEYYLTDTLPLLRERGRIGAVLCAHYSEALGINNRSDQAIAEQILNRRKIESLMVEGVTFLDPSSTFVGDEVTIGPDTVIWPQTFLLGRSKIGSKCHIGPWTHIKNVIVGDEVSIQASFCEDSIIRSGAKVGPYSRVRPKSDIGENAHLGNFSEVKNATLGTGAKANHLSYLGDAKIGKNVNIGAGSITCNYDGTQKHPTEIQDHAFIGSNVNLIAPVRVGSHAVVGAGSSISDDVPAWSLALERASLKVKKNWVRSRPKKGK